MGRRRWWNQRLLGSPAEKRLGSMEENGDGGYECRKEEHGLHGSASVMSYDDANVAQRTEATTVVCERWQIAREIDQQRRPRHGWAWLDDGDGEIDDDKGWAEWCGEVDGRA
ncbi:hypothetical protein M0R45_019504 [Rubus argutus]|uniref:MHC class I antigen n=1 Tax=Rubus argutus TaxID=59490 RepID=A0AAW1X5I3_RUBAR